MHHWRLKSKHDVRFKAGHPWVYSNELQESPKGVAPGEAVELCDAGGKFLARGYGNPNSLIAFRAMTRNAEILDPLSQEELKRSLSRALDQRRMLGLGRTSFRWVFGEGDFIPGLIIDRYAITGHEAQVIVIQAHTAGVDRVLKTLIAAIREVIETEKLGVWATTEIVVRNDLGVREREGLTSEKPRIEKKSEFALDAQSIDADIRGHRFQIDVIDGQKTGFFLDQCDNIERATKLFARLRDPSNEKKVRILDLCSYVGHWTVRLARSFESAGVSAEVLAVDVSEEALKRVRTNAERAGLRSVKTLKANVLKELDSLPERSFDLIISDPPALVQARKDLPQGTHAYLQLNTQVMRLVRSGGGVVCCSCSGLLPEETFIATLEKSARRNQRLVRWVARGGQAIDHPSLAGFTEGRYLKAFFGFSE